MKIGIGITTFERFNNFRECFEHLLKNSRDLEEIIVVDDCSIKDKELYDKYFEELDNPKVLVFRNKVNCGVGKSKNMIMKYFFEHDYEWFFTLEDDININSPELFAKYIRVAIDTGIHYLNFGGHGELNQQYEPILSTDGRIKLWKHLVGAFTLYSRELVLNVGYHDTTYFNALEHVDYYYRCMKHYPELYHYWEFPDIVDSEGLIVEQDNALESSTIRKRSDWSFNVIQARNYFFTKHGIPFVGVPREYHESK